MICWPSILHFQSDKSCWLNSEKMIHKIPSSSSLSLFSRPKTISLEYNRKICHEHVNYGSPARMPLVGESVTSYTSYISFSARKLPYSAFEFFRSIFRYIYYTEIYRYIRKLVTRTYESTRPQLISN